MFGRDRGDRGALVALTVVVVGAVFASWLGQPSNQQKTEPATSNIYQTEKDNVLQAVSTAEGFDPWRDSYAQWGMAALSLLATGVSGWAIFLLRSTLAETRRTADAAFRMVEIERERNLPALFIADIKGIKYKPF